MRVITITLNPAIDKTISCDTFEIGETNRINSFIEDVAGKGINVSKNLRMLGLESEIAGIFSGNNGKRSIKELSEMKYALHVFEAVGETRLNQKIVDKNGQTTELNEKGPLVSKETLNGIRSWVASLANEETLFVISGSIPQGVPTTFYKELVESIKNKKGQCILDVSGEPLIEAIKAVPTCIKPNIDECQQILGLDYKPSLDEVKTGLRGLIDKGVKLIAISLGKEGALFINKEGNYYAKGLDVKALSTVGAGDAMVGSLTYSLVNDEDIDMLIKRAISVSAAAVETEGTKPGSLNRVQELMNQVEIVEELR